MNPADQRRGSTRRETAIERVVNFSQSFGQRHLTLACHAAFPLALTPDLLYQVWASFVPQAPWTAVADLLLSSLCSEVGYELYEMDTPVRNLLLRDLKEDEQLGQQRLNDLSRFLMAYVKRELTSRNPDRRFLARAQQWTALAYSHPSRAAEGLAQILSEMMISAPGNKAVLLGFASLVESLEDPLAGFEPLIACSRDVVDSIRGDTQDMRDQILVLDRVIAAHYEPGAGEEKEPQSSEALLAHTTEGELADGGEKAEDEECGLDFEEEFDASLDLEEEFDASRVSSIDTVGVYLQELAELSPLTHEEEVRLAKAVEAGREAQAMRANHVEETDRKELDRQIAEGLEARERLIEANMRLVVAVAEKYMGRGVPFLDLIQEGNLGLVKAVKKFDHTQGHRFSTYATWWIRQTITRSIADQGRTIRVPVHMSDRIRRLYKTARKLEQEYGRQPTPEEIAEEMDMEPHKVRWLLRLSWRPMSLERPIGDEGDSDELGSFIEDRSNPMPIENASQRLLAEKIQEMLTTLSPREARILRLRFGLVDGCSHTRDEIEQRFGLTPEQVRQIEERALRRLRHPRRSRELRGFL